MISALYRRLVNIASVKCDVHHVAPFHGGEPKSYLGMLTRELLLTTFGIDQRQQVVTPRRENSIQGQEAE